MKRWRSHLSIGTVLVVGALGGGCSDSDSASSSESGPTSSSATSGSGGASTSTASGAQGGAGGSGIGGEGGAGGSVDRSASPGCIDGAGLPEGEATFDLDGTMRRYILHLPNGYTKDKKWPVVLALHPNGGNIDYWNATDGPRNIRAQVQDDAILLVAEDVTHNWPDDLPTELAYFDKILTQLEAELCVDLDEIFSMGFSGGGSFSGVLGCMRPDIRAIASGGAIIYFEPADCVNVPAAWVTIGTLELVPERAEFRDFWRDRAMCAETTMPTDPNPPCVAYDDCAVETPVHYCQHDGDHVWPSFGTEAAWAFFKQFVKE